MSLTDQFEGPYTEGQLKRTVETLVREGYELVGDDNAAHTRTYRRDASPTQHATIATMHLAELGAPRNISGRMYLNYPEFDCTQITTVAKYPAHVTQERQLNAARLKTPALTR